MSSPCVNERCETAVAATTSEIVNPTVAISSIVAARRREAVFLSRRAKPGIPVSSAMAVVLANHLFRGHKIAADWGGAIEE
jgi:hypothetical protein